MNKPINRIAHIFTDEAPPSLPAQGEQSDQSLSNEEVTSFFEDLDLDDPEYQEPDPWDNFDNNDDDDEDNPDDDDDGWDDDDEDDEELDPDAEDMLQVIADPDTVITEARMIFQRSKSGHLMMTCKIEDASILDEEFDDSGDEMWEGELIFRLTMGYGGAKKVIRMPNPSHFRKSNWNEELCE